MDVQAQGAERFASTDSGLFTQSGSVCDWTSGPASASNEWLLSFSLSRSTANQDPAAFALVIDAETQEIHVERSAAGQDFTVVHTFDNLSGYREVEAGGDPASVFIGGYTYEPRTYNLAFSLDAGESWQELSPDVDNESTTMVLNFVDPDAPHAVFIEAETPVGQSDELYRFDADSGQIERVLTLGDAEVFGGMARGGDTLWVAGRHRGGGSLFRADRETLEFSLVSDSGPEFACLGADDSELFACVNDFTYASEFVVGRSADEGQTWTGLLTVTDLGQVTSCGGDCSTTMDWLHETFGPLAAEGAAPNTDATSAESGSDGGCAYAGRRAPRSGLSLLFGFGLAMALCTRLWRRFALAV